MKKTLSILLSFVMLISITAGIDLSAQAASYYESESNDSYSTADNLYPGDSIIGSMNSTRDTDYYKVIPSSNGKLSFDFIHQYTENSSVFWYVSIYKYSDGEYNEIDNITVYGNGNEKVTLPYIGAVANGSYYIKVSTYWEDTVNKEYTISSTFVNSNYYEKELNNSYYSATVMNTNKTYSGCMNKSSDVDYYKIIAPSNGKMAFTFNHKYRDNSAVFWYVTMYYYANGEYNQLFNETIYGYSNEKTTLPYIGTVKNGVYYIKVATYWSDTVGENYSITNSFTTSNYYEKELNNSYYTATNISIGNQYSGNMNSSNDTDYYKLSLSSGNNIKMTFSHPNMTNSAVFWYVDIYKYSNGEYTNINDRQTIYGTDGNKTVLKQYLSSGTYYIKVSTYWNDTSGINYNLKTDIYLSTPSSLKVSSRNTTSLKLSWDKVSGVSGYELQQYKGSKWATIKNANVTSHTVKGLKAGTFYKFRIRTYKTVGGKKYYSGWKELGACTKPSTVSLSSVKASKGKKITVKWKKTNCTGYQIQYATNSKFTKNKKTVTIKKNKTTSKTISKLKAKKKYYVRVRAYKTVDGKKVYGSWSKTKIVTTKK